MRVCRTILIAMMLAATPAGATEPTAPAPESQVPVEAAVRLLIDPSAGLGPSTAMFQALKAFIESGRAYEACGVRAADEAVERNVEALLSSLREQVGEEHATEAEILEGLVRNGVALPAPTEELSDAFTSLKGLYRAVTEPLAAATEPLTTATGQLAEGLYRGSAAEQAVVWSNEQVADACTVIAGLSR